MRSQHRAHSLGAQLYRTDTTSQVPCPYFWLTDCTLRFHDPLLRFDNLLKWVTEFRKALFIFTGRLQRLQFRTSKNGRNMYQTRCCWSFVTSMLSLSVLCWCFQVLNTKISEYPNSGVFMEFNSRPSCLQRVWGLDPKFHLPSHLLVILIRIMMTLCKGPTVSDIIRITQMRAIDAAFN